MDLTTVAKVGDTMETKVLKVNDGEGQVLLTYKRLAAEKGNKRLEEAYENKEVLKAPVAQVLDGGLSVLIDERVYSFLQAWFLILMKEILRNMRDRRLSL